MAETMVSLFRRLTSGVYVVGVGKGERINAFTAAWAIQASFDPLLVVICINPRHASYRIVKESGVFSINVLKKDQLDLARHFGKPSTADKLAVIPWHPGRSGAPVLDQGLAYFDCRVSHECPAGDHALIIGHVIDGALLEPDAEPLYYRDTGDMDGSSALYPAGF